MPKRKARGQSLDENEYGAAYRGRTPPFYPVMKSCEEGMHRDGLNYRDGSILLARAANPYHAARTRRVSAATLAPTSGEVVTEFQSDSSRTDSPGVALIA